MERDKPKEKWMRVIGKIWGYDEDSYVKRVEGKIRVADSICVRLRKFVKRTFVQMELQRNQLMCWNIVFVVLKTKHWTSSKSDMSNIYEIPCLLDVIFI